MRATFALVLLIGGLHDCDNDHLCKPGTLAVGVQLDDGTASADHLSVTVTIEGVMGTPREVPHVSGDHQATFEILFPHGYHIGAVVIVDVVAKDGVTVLGEGAGAVRLVPKCSALAVLVSATAQPDLSVAVDLATCNVSTHCGAACINCSAQSAGNVCVNNGGTFQCGCNNDGDCPSGSFCSSSACVSCNLDTHCGSSCINCSAQADNRQCMNGVCGCSSGGCSPTSFCNGGSCHACGVSTQCSNGTVCLNCSSRPEGHACTNPGTTQPCGCNSDGDCSSGQLCNAGLCQP